MRAELCAGAFVVFVWPHDCHSTGYGAPACGGLGCTYGQSQDSRIVRVSLGVLPWMSWAAGALFERAHSTYYSIAKYRMHDNTRYGTAQYWMQLRLRPALCFLLAHILAFLLSVTGFSGEDLSVPWATWAVSTPNGWVLSTGLQA